MASQKHLIGWLGLAIAGAGVLATLLAGSLSGNTNTNSNNINTTNINNNTINNTINNNIINGVSPPGTTFIINYAWAPGHTGPGKSGLTSAGAIAIGGRIYQHSIAFSICGKGGPLAIAFPPRRAASTFSAAVGVIGDTSAAVPANRLIVRYSLKDVPAANAAGDYQSGWVTAVSTPLQPGKTLAVRVAVPAGARTIGLGFEGVTGTCQSRLAWGNAGLS